MNRRYPSHIVTDADLDRALYSLRECARLSQGESAQMRAALLSQAKLMPLPRQPGRFTRFVMMLAAAFRICEDRPMPMRRLSISVPNHFHIDRYSSRWLLLNAFS